MTMGAWWRASRALVSVLGLALSGCSTIKVNTGHEPQADFSRFRTFAFAAGEKDAVPQVRALLEREISSALVSKGMRRVDRDPDLEVHMIGGLEDMERLDAVTTTQAGYGWGGTVGYESLTSWGVALEQRVPVGVLVVDLVDPDRNQGVWRGAVRAALTRDPETDIKRIQTAVAKLFSGYPPRSR